MGRACGMQVGPGAEAGVDKALRGQLVEGRPVGLFPVVLEVGAFVPEQAEGFEIALRGIRIGGLRALSVEVLDAQHDAPALRFRHEPRGERREHVARVHAPCGRRREASDHGVATGRFAWPGAEVLHVRLLALSSAFPPLSRGRRVAESAFFPESKTTNAAVGENGVICASGFGREADRRSCHSGILARRSVRRRGRHPAVRESFRKGRGFVQPAGIAHPLSVKPTASSCPPRAAPCPWCARCRRAPRASRAPPRGARLSGAPRQGGAALPSAGTSR